VAKKKGTKKKKKSAGRSFFPGGAVFKGKIAIILLSVLVIAGIFYGIRYFFLNSPLFKINEVIINSSQDYLSGWKSDQLKERYIGRNIFTVDLKQTEVLTGKEFPQLRRVEVKRRLPDVVEIDLISRGPAAIIDVAGGVIVDKEGVVLSTGRPGKDLVKIKGIRFFRKVPPVGGKINNKTLTKALQMLEGLNRGLRKNKGDIKYIDISNANNIIVNISGVEIRMGRDDFSYKINELKKIIDDPNIYLSDIKYIDLRFEDIVIAPR